MTIYRVGSIDDTHDTLVSSDCFEQSIHAYMRDKYAGYKYHLSHWHGPYKNEHGEREVQCSVNLSNRRARTVFYLFSIEARVLSDPRLETTADEHLPAGFDNA